MFFLNVFLVTIALLILHELAHILMALSCGLKVYEVGFALRPMPHLYVACEFSTHKIKRILYYFAGIISTGIIFIIAYQIGFLSIDFVFYGIVNMMIMETNPFYSDVIIYTILRRKKHIASNYFKVQFKKDCQNYLFSVPWYLHFFLWTAYLYTLLNLKNYFL